MKLAKLARSGVQLSSPTRHRLSPIRVMGVSVPSHNLPPRSTTTVVPHQGLSLTYRPVKRASAGSEAGAVQPAPCLTKVLPPQLTPTTRPLLRSNLKVNCR